MSFSYLSVELVQQVSSWMEQYHGEVLLWIGLRPVLITASPKDAQVFDSYPNSFRVVNYKPYSIVNQSSYHTQLSSHFEVAPLCV